MYLITDMNGYLILKEHHISDRQYQSINARLGQYWDLDITEDGGHVNISLRFCHGSLDSTTTIATLDDLDTMLTHNTKIGDDEEISYGDISVSLQSDDHDALGIVYELYDGQLHRMIV